jgi:hypothetical protein
LDYFGFMYGQLLAPFIRENSEVREKRLAISSAAINRKPKTERKKHLLRSVSGTKPGTWLKHTAALGYTFCRFLHKDWQAFILFIWGDEPDR